MADLLVLSIVVLAIGCKYSLRDPAERVVLHLDQEMDVVWHQAIGVKIERQLRFLERQDIGEAEIIRIGAEDFSTVIAAGDDGIEPSGDFDSWFARHGSRDPGEWEQNVNELKPDPF